MEACGGAQHWARKLAALGHDVRLLPALQVKAFACGNKNDTADARAIWMAVQQRGVRTAAIKTEAGSARDAPGTAAANKVSYRADQHAARSIDRVRRGHAARTQQHRQASKRCPNGRSQTVTAGFRRPGTEAAPQATRAGEKGGLAHHNGHQAIPKVRPDTASTADSHIAIGSKRVI